MASKPPEKQAIEKDYLVGLLTWMDNGYYDLGNPKRQKELLERALPIQEKHHGSDYFKVAITLINLGTAYGTLGYPQKQKELLERALSILKKYYSSDHFIVATALVSFGIAYRALSNPRKAKELLEKAFSNSRKTLWA